MGNEVLYVECSICGRKEKFDLTPEESKTLDEYRIKGREMGTIQSLFSRIPAWIRSGAIDQYSGGFCICPKCCEMESERR